MHQNKLTILLIELNVGLNSYMLWFSDERWCVDNCYPGLMEEWLGVGMKLFARGEILFSKSFRIRLNWAQNQSYFSNQGPLEIPALSRVSCSRSACTPSSGSCSNALRQIIAFWKANRFSNNTKETDLQFSKFTCDFIIGHLVFKHILKFSLFYVFVHTFRFSKCYHSSKSVGK